MELLSVKVKKGRLDKAADAFKTYVVLKVQNLKSTTIDRRGSEPCWEQDFMFEICADGKGFIIELWKKGLLWDSILGVLWIPLATVKHATDEGPGSWWTLHSEVIKNGSEIQGTKTPTSHEILLDVYFALPFDTQKDLDCRGWHRGTPLQGARCSHQDTYDSLSTIESGLSIKESELRRNKDQADESNFAKARWARAIQKQPSLFEAMLMKQLSPLSSILSENLRGMEDESLPMPNHNKLYSWNWLKKYHRQKEQAAQEDQETKHS